MYYNSLWMFYLVAFVFSLVFHCVFCFLRNSRFFFFRLLFLFLPLVHFLYCKKKTFATNPLKNPWGVRAYPAAFLLQCPLLSDGNKTIIVSVIACANVCICPLGDIRPDIVSWSWSATFMPLCILCRVSQVNFKKSCECGWLARWNNHFANHDNIFPLEVHH